MAKPPNNKRVLVVEDDESLREVLRYNLKDEGFTFIEAEDGAKGLEVVGAFKPQIILLDLMMPNLSGFDVIKGLQRDGFGHIPVIVMTAYTPASNEALLRLEPNVKDFVKKPIAYDDLMVRVHKILDGEG